MCYHLDITDNYFYKVFFALINLRYIFYGRDSFWRERENGGGRREKSRKKRGRRRRRLGGRKGGGSEGEKREERTQREGENERQTFVCLEGEKGQEGG